jgi:hypothetical protein
MANERIYVVRLAAQMTGKTFSVKGTRANGNVYFTTTGTCASWCEISFATPAANNQAYAMLLTANAQGASVTFDWPNLTSCSTQNQVYASPGWIDLP